MTMPLAIFVSDVHLREASAATADAFLDFLHDTVSGVPALYLLGDLFEYWAGDDDIGNAFHWRIASSLKALADSGTALYWIAGNRDFLVGEGFARTAALTLLPDPHMIDLAGLSILLTHGDASCTDDLSYMEFRKQVRSPEWQRQFLAMPLEKRKQIIEGLREGSRNAQREKSYDIMDVNAGAIEELFNVNGTEIMIHGHTHRPAIHNHNGKLRYVLPDWDCESETRRGGWLELHTDGRLVQRDV
jgi:UDP-2,3-diacylglucosamine hydrolase